ncbi:hypothetical protein [Vreelandella nigrificans]|nr:hypothetical protein [Halomonas nigrificans]
MMANQDSPTTTQHKPTPAAMTEVESLREMLVERNDAFRLHADLPFSEQMELLGQQPGSTLLEMLSMRLESFQATKQTPRITDVEEHLHDAMTLAARSMFSALNDAETWRLCYRLAYLVGYGIPVVDRSTAAAAKARREERIRVARSGGNNRWKEYGPIRDRFASLVPSGCYDANGKRLQKAKAAEIIWYSLATVFPESSMPKEGAVFDWLTDWHKAEGFPAWPKLPKHWNQWPQS